MAYKLSAAWFVFAALVSICVHGRAWAAGNQPPAGKMCAQGAYVIGFDLKGNIICSDMAGTGSQKSTEITRQEQNQAGDD